MITKEIIGGTCYVRGVKGPKFVNPSAAIVAMQMLQYYFACSQCHCVSHVNLSSHTISLTVHFSDICLPRVPEGYNYSQRVLYSHWYYSEVDCRACKVRTADFYFDF